MLREIVAHIPGKHTHSLPPSVGMPGQTRWHCPNRPIQVAGGANVGCDSFSSSYARSLTIGSAQQHRICHTRTQVYVSAGSTADANACIKQADMPCGIARQRSIRPRDDAIIASISISVTVLGSRNAPGGVSFPRRMLGRAGSLVANGLWVPLWPLCPGPYALPVAHRPVGAWLGTDLKIEQGLDSRGLFHLNGPAGVDRGCTQNTFPLWS